MIQNAARSGWRSARHRRSKKRRPSTRWRWALQQLIHRGSGSTDSTMTSNPPRHGRRTFPVDYTFCFLMVGRSPRCAACGTRTHAARPARVRFARRHDDPELMIAHLRARAVHPDGRPAPVDFVRHACTSSFGTNPNCSDGTKSRTLMSPQSTARRIHGQVGDSCLQHDALRFGLFSLSCPRLRCVRPTEAMAGPLLRRQSRSRRIQICKERTMLRGTRPRGR